MPESRKRRVTRELAEEASSIKPSASTPENQREYRLGIYKDICTTLNWLNALLDESEEYAPERDRGRIEKTWDY